MPIVSYRIEPEGGQSFSVWVRRKSGPAIPGIIIMTALIMMLPATFFYRSFSTHPSLSAISRPAGIPICVMPFVVSVVGIATWRMVQGEITQFKGIAGKEQWLFAPREIAPPAGELGIQLPPLLSELQGIRARLNVTGGKWVIDFSSGSTNLYLGPFDSKALALRCEAELRRLRPGWFTEPAGIATLNGVLGETRFYGFRTRAEPIISFEPVQLAEGGCLLELRRQRGYRPLTIRILPIWLCGWLVAEVLVGRILLSEFTRLPGPGHGDSTAAKLFLIAWFSFWNLGGFLALRMLILGLKQKETWRFTRNAITAGRSWHWFSPRRLPIDSTIQVRFGPFANPPSVDFISGGLLLHLGPFATWDLAGEAMGDVQRQFPHWHWPNVPQESP